MIAAFSSAGKGIIVPTYAGRRGHPLLFSVRYCGEILTDYDQQGLRRLLAAHPEDVFEFPVSSSAVLADMNDPEDYRRELARLAPRSDPAIIPLERGEQPGSASRERGGG
jgi:molybdenum cofactor cytidylyltransferase